MRCRLDDPSVVARRMFDLPPLPKDIHNAREGVVLCARHTAVTASGMRTMFKLKSRQFAEVSLVCVMTSR